MFGEVLFSDLGDGCRSLPYNNSPNYAFCVCVEVLCVLSVVCMYMYV